MSVRTDLAIEAEIPNNELCKSIIQSEKINGNVKTTVTEILDKQGADATGKPKGKYITVEFPSIDASGDLRLIKSAIVSALSELIVTDGTVLVAGLGNPDITPDAIGPLSADGILATRHIGNELAENIGLKGLKSVAVFKPDVLGKTGIETLELVKGAVAVVKPSAVLVIDALAAKSRQRLFKTVQISETGINPGSGVKNSRCEISEKTLGVKTVAVGVPTVTDADSLALELTRTKPLQSSEMIVTLKDVDMLCDKISKLLASALNAFLQPNIDEELILSLF